MIDVQYELKMQIMLYLSRMRSGEQIGHTNHLAKQSKYNTQLSRLSVNQLQQLASVLPFDAIQVSINEQALQHSFAKLDESTKQQETIRDLLLAGASTPVINKLYGLTREDVAEQRRLLSVKRQTGRPAALSDAQQVVVRSLWKQRTRATPGESLLDLHHQTEIPVNVLWPTVQHLL